VPRHGAPNCDRDLSRLCLLARYRRNESPASQSPRRRAPRAGRRPSRPIRRRVAISDATRARRGGQGVVEAVQRARRRRADERVALAASRYAAMGWPVCLGAQPRAPRSRDRRPRHRQPSQRLPPQAAPARACSCDRIGCPAPGAHPLSPVWKLQATADVAIVGHWWRERPHANILLVTGRSFDVLDVPRRAGLLALRRLNRSGISPGPVAISASERALFFVATRAAQGDDDEWWSCHLDCEPEVLPAVAGLRWHCRGSYVVAPPSRLSNGLAARWIAAPGTRPLPDALRLLEILADACEEIT
jgi:hypothetical protein